MTFTAWPIFLNLSDKPITDVNEIAKAGDVIDLKILSIEPTNHRLGLSLKGVKEKSAIKPAEEKNKSVALETEAPAVEEKAALAKETETPADNKKAAPAKKTAKKADPAGDEPKKKKTKSK